MALNFATGSGLFSNSEVLGEGLNPDPTMTVINNNGGINERSRNAAGAILYSSAKWGDSATQETWNQAADDGGIYHTIKTLVTQDISFIKFLSLSVAMKATIDPPSAPENDVYVQIIDQATSTQLLTGFGWGNDTWRTFTATKDISLLNWKGTRTFLVQVAGSGFSYDAFVKDLLVYHEGFFATSNEYTTGI